MTGERKKCRLPSEASYSGKCAQRHSCFCHPARRTLPPLAAFEPLPGRVCFSCCTAICCRGKFPACHLSTTFGSACRSSITTGALAAALLPFDGLPPFCRGWPLILGSVLSLALCADPFPSAESSPGPPRPTGTGACTPP